MRERERGREGERSTDISMSPANAWGSDVECFGSFRWILANKYAVFRLFSLFFSGFGAVEPTGVNSPTEDIHFLVIIRSIKSL
jgi:hypothetical protein